MNDTQKLAHLLRRAGFGAGPKELDEARRDGYETTLERLLNFESVPDPSEAELAEVQDALLDMRNMEDVRTAWLFRMVRTTRPLQERLTIFWHNHFATGAGKVESAVLMNRQIEMFRRHSAGNFRSLLLDVSRDPAMLIWLDGRANRKGRPNENYGRELMELFTIGIGHYTENDVKQVARAFTGWTLREGSFHFEPNQHDGGEKQILGRKGKFGGEDVVDILTQHAETPRRLARKLFAEFVGPKPDAETVEKVAASYTRGGFDVREMLRTLLTSKAFLSDDALFARIKSPTELAVGALRAMPHIIPLKYLPGHLRRMGQDLLSPPTVKGWDGGAAWLSSTTLLNRMNMAKDVAVGVGNTPSPALRPAEFVKDLALDTPDKLVDHMLERFGPLEVSPTVKAKLVEYVLAPEQNKGPVFPDPRTHDTKVRGVAQLVMSLPEFQLA